MMSVEHAIHWVYPYTLLLGHEGKMAVEGVLKVSTCFLYFSTLLISWSFPSASFPCTPLIFPYLSFFLCLPFSPLLRQEAFGANNKKAMVGSKI